MTLQKFLAIALLLVLLLGGSQGAFAQEEIDAKKLVWINRLRNNTLTQPTEYQEIVDFVNEDSQFVLEVLRDYWNRIRYDRLRQHLFLSLTSPNLADNRVKSKVLETNTIFDEEGVKVAVSTHRSFEYPVELVSIGLNDKDPIILENAKQVAFGMALEEIQTYEGFQNWRSRQKGLTNAEVMKRSCTKFVNKLQTTPESNVTPILRRVVQLYDRIHEGMRNSYSISTAGGVVNYKATYKYEVRYDEFAGLRRKSLLEAGILEHLKKYLQPNMPDDMRDAAIQLLHVLRPEIPDLLRFDEELRREIPRQIQTGKMTIAVELLRLVQKPWSEDLLLSLLDRNDIIRGRVDFQSILKALSMSNDKRLIPALIKRYDDLNPGRTSDNLITGILFKLIKEPLEDSNFPGLSHPGMKINTPLGEWWREWWIDNRGSFSAKVQAIFPHSRKLSMEILSKRRAGRISLGDSNRNYHLFFPLIQGNIPQTENPGLIVVLSNTGSKNEQLAWRRFSQVILTGHYLVAYVYPPVANPNEPWRWHLSSGATSASNIPISEQLANGVVNDLQALIPLDKSRIFLVGEEQAGMPALYSALSPKSPFSGFLVLSAAFRTEQLPPLKNAKGRRVYIQHDKADKTTPLFLATSAETLLKKNGARVQLQVIANNPLNTNTPLEVERDKQDKLLKAIEWLEKSK